MYMLYIYCIYIHIIHIYIVHVYMYTSLCTNILYMYIYISYIYIYHISLKQTPFSPHRASAWHQYRRASPCETRVRTRTRCGCGWHACAVRLASKWPSECARHMARPHPASAYVLRDREDHGRALPGALLHREPCKLDPSARFSLAITIG